MNPVNNNIRDEIIAKVIDAPETLTIDEIALIDTDAELRELYETAVLCKDASLIKNIEIPDVEKELAKFKASRRNIVPIMNRWSILQRIAAIFAGVVVTSLTALAVFVPHSIDYFFTEAPKDVATEQISKNTYVGEVAPVSGDVQEEIVTDKELLYDNITLEIIVNELAEIYKVKVEFVDNKAKDLRLYVKIEQGKTAKECVEILGAFEQFEIALKEGVITIK